MNPKDAIWFAAAAAAAVFLVDSPIVSKTSNCGGNSAALSHVRNLSNFARVMSTDRLDGTFRFVKMSADETREFEWLSDSRWNGGAKFLVRSGVLTFDSTDRQIIVVCDKPYRNVPQRTFGQSPPTHAAAWSDGTVGLITPEEFLRLDFSHFVDVKSLVSSL